MTATTTAPSTEAAAVTWKATDSGKLHRASNGMPARHPARVMAYVMPTEVGGVVRRWDVYYYRVLKGAGFVATDFAATTLEEAKEVAGRVLARTDLATYEAVRGAVEDARAGYDAERDMDVHEAAWREADRALDAHPTVATTAAEQAAWDMLMDAKDAAGQCKHLGCRVATDGMAHCAEHTV